MNRLLQQKGWTKTEFAERIGISQQQVSKILRSGNPTLKTIEQFAKGLNVDTSEIVGGESLVSLSETLNLVQMQLKTADRMIAQMVKS